MAIQLKVHGLKGEVKNIDLCKTDKELRKITVTQLRDKVAQELGITQEIRLIFRTTPLEDDTSLVLSYGIKHMSTINVVLRLPGGIRCGPEAGGKTPHGPTKK